MTSDIVGRKIWVQGIVQGVGFRPFIYNLARQLSITGWVRNTSNGVEIEVNGIHAALQSFLDQLRTSPPPLARIDSITEQTCPPGSYSTFDIHTSLPLPGEFNPVSPDMAICPDCHRELFAPTDRRYRYPFINCTNCGPRFTIIHDIPYDRPNTTMAAFPLCVDCQREYEDPSDRRFHAQPVACPVCGPQLTFIVTGQKVAKREEALKLARQKIMDGKIVAIKGLGGYHLACDATHPDAVAELRRRKKRSDKPFAVMTFDLATAQKHCAISEVESDLLLSRQSPVVLLDKLPSSSISPDVAPHQSTCGLMLAYTPLHLLLLEPAADFPEVLVMTSGNLSEEPIAFQDQDALQRLAEVADAFLIHDRPIQVRLDDSVTRVVQGKPYLIRRSRGYSPEPILLDRKVPSILAVGAELKNTFCLTRDRYAFLSHHIGDMENYETYRSFEEGIEHFLRLFQIEPQRVACDLHPDYLPSQYAREFAQRTHLPLLQIQHHHAHLAACLADNQFIEDEPVIGLCFDGTGLGADGAIWGSEFLLGGYREVQRLYHLCYMPLPGGDAAIRKTARTALAALWANGMDWDPALPPVQALSNEDRTLLHSMLTHSINTPQTSSMGRLFDVVSALAGIRQETNYEGQAAIELEAAADPYEQGSYRFEILADQVNPAPVFTALVSDFQHGVPASIISARFHNGLAQMVGDVCCRIRDERSAKTVALSGGVWQNRLLLTKTMKKLKDLNLSVLMHQRVPTNDGCIALGQALVASSLTI
jgi:hydrogenase maturation protein HypF